MLINLRGTSGSGKSTIVRRVRDHYPLIRPVRVDGRKQPIGYVQTYKTVASDVRPLGIVGHYETECGGCDTVPTMDKIFELVKQGDHNGINVLFEGLLISADLKRTQELHNEGRELLVIGLTTPLDVCLDSVNQRRRRRFDRQGKPEKYTPVNSKNTASKHKGVLKSIEKMQAHGMDAIWASRDEAFKIIMRRFGWTVDENGIITP